MILSTHGVLASAGGIPIDADAQAFFDRVTAAGGSLTNTEKTAVNNLVISLKANSLWTPMKAIYPMVGASSAACRQNLKSSSFTGIFSSGWTFASTGVTPNGTSAYFDTGLPANTQLSLTNSHLSFYSRTDFSDTNGRVDMGRGFTAASSYINLFIKLQSPANLMGGSFGGKDTTTAIVDGKCFAIITATSSTSQKVYRNGTVIVNSTNASSGDLSQTLNIYIGSQGNSTGAAQFSTRQCAFASIGDGLTDTQASNLYTAVQAFQTTLSRQV